MKMRTIINILMLITFSAIISSCLVESKKDQEINRTYILVKRDTSFCGVVDSMFMFTPFVNGSMCVRLSDGLKFQAAAGASSPTIDPRINFFDFIAIGDTLLKREGKDSIIVLKNGYWYSFSLVTQEYHDSVFNKGR